MTDDKLISEVARVWVDGGGDADGIDWCHQQIKSAVIAEIERREQENGATGDTNDERNHD